MELNVQPYRIGDLEDILNRFGCAGDLIRLPRPASNHGEFYIFTPEKTVCIPDFGVLERGHRYFIKYSPTIQSELKGSKLLADNEYPTLPLITLSCEPSGAGFGIASYVERPTLQQKLLKLEGLSKSGCVDTQEEVAKFLEVVIAFYCLLANKELATWRANELNILSNSPIHDLFSKRLGADGRLGQWYLGKKVLEGNDQIDFDDLKTYSWRINGISYRNTLAQLIESAKEALDPASIRGVILGHGDPHLWNIFLPPEESASCASLFDHQNAGHHHPYLEVAKSLASGPFWSYIFSPRFARVDSKDQVTFKLSKETKQVEVNYRFVMTELQFQVLTIIANNLLFPFSSVMNADPLHSRLKLFGAALFCSILLPRNFFAPFRANEATAEGASINARIFGISLAVLLGSIMDNENYWTGEDIPPTSFEKCAQILMNKVSLSA